MTEFNFIVSDVKAAKKTIKIMDKKFNANEQANKILYREFTHVKDDIFKCEFVFPFPDLRFAAWVFLGINFIIYYFYRHLWIFAGSIVLLAAAYSIKYMTSNKYYFKMLCKGMSKNGYKGQLMRF